MAGACALALGMGGLSLATAPARAAVDPLTAPLDTHSVAADLIGVAGTTLVTSSDLGGTHLKHKGELWATTDLDRGIVASDVTFVDASHVVALLPGKVQVLDTDGNTAQSFDVEEGVRAATVNTAVAVDGWEQGVPTNPRALDLQAQAWRDLAWPGVLTPPDGFDRDLSGLGQGWITEDAWIAPMVYFGSNAAVLDTDLDVVPLTGTVSQASVRVPGTVLWAALGKDAGGAQVVNYVSLAAKTLRSCTANGDIAAPVATCRTIKTKVSGTPAVHAFADAGGTTVLGLTLGTTNYLWQANKLVKVTGVPGGSKGAFTSDGVGSRPVLSVRGSKPGFYTVATTGKAKLIVPAVVEAVSLEALDLGASWVAGIDNATSKGRGWVRAASDPLGSQVVLSTKADQIATSGSRFVVNGGDGLWFYKDGIRTAKLKAATYLESLSGPFALVVAKDGTSTLRTDAKVVASGIKGLAASFGSLVASVDRKAATVTVKDHATSAAGITVPFTAQGDVYQVGIWGDWVMLGQIAIAGDELTYTTTVIDYRNSDTWSTSLMPINLGDGIVSGLSPDGQWVLWDFQAQSMAAVTDVADPPVASSVGKIAYGAGNGLLTIATRDDAGGNSSPRALATTAGPGTSESFFRAFDGWRLPWKVSVEATKALAEGVLSITDSEGTVVAERTVTASASGTISATWDGLKDSDGAVADTGNYTWALTVPAADGTGSLQRIDGSAVPSGSIDVENERFIYPLATPKIDHAKPVVGQVLTANPGPQGADTVFTFQWFSGSTPVGTNDPHYTVAVSDLGRKLTVRVAVDPGSYYLDAVPRTSAATSKVAKGTIIKPLITFGADPVVGTPLTPTIGAWVPAMPPVTYQWYRLDAKGKSKLILHATSLQYVPAAADLKYRLKLVVTAKRAGYNTATANGVTLAAVVSG